MKVGRYKSKVHTMYLLHRQKFTFVGNPCDYHVKPTIALIEAIKKSNRKNGNEVGKQLFLIQE